MAASPVRQDDSSDPSAAAARRSSPKSGAESTRDEPIRLREGDALLLVDLQKDFLPGGHLPVRHGDHIVATANTYLARFLAHRLPVFASRDWHPPDHCSFQAQGGAWPPHCVAGSAGAAFPGDLQLPPGTCVVSKAVSANRDAYSAFDGTPLKDLLCNAGIERLFVGGLATDYCVFETVKAAA
ncbi:MAG: pyrazinamidase/nicotinamidase, partial [Proteobacteria bacterium]|nr:pyrazinamidase/nicotinamidase [Pseudomonadota bacterium]